MSQDKNADIIGVRPPAGQQSGPLATSLFFERKQPKALGQPDNPSFIQSATGFRFVHCPRAASRIGDLTMAVYIAAVKAREAFKVDSHSTCLRCGFACME